MLSNSNPVYLQDYVDSSILSRESVQNQLRDFINSRQLSSQQQLAVSSPQLSYSHRRQGSQDSQENIGVYTATVSFCL